MDGHTSSMPSRTGMPHPSAEAGPIEVDQTTVAPTTVSDTPISILDLPPEIQTAIFNKCSKSDLICSSLVCKKFRDLAAAEVYRNFDFDFPDNEILTCDGSIDKLAGGLDTFITSDYNYGQHLRRLVLDTLNGGEKAEAAYKPYLYSTSSGKFLNTLLLLTLRKTKRLEDFRWNIRVELDRRVYKQLHEIDTLKMLQIRLQAGPSLYETPPPLPIYPETSSGAFLVSAPTYHLEPAPPQPPPPLFAGAPPGFSNFTIPPSQGFYLVPPANMGPPPPLPPPKLVTTRHRPARRTGFSKEPPTLSGFKNLRMLSVLDIDDLDIVTELKACVRKSASTLTRVQLSFSDQLGSRARKPTSITDHEDAESVDAYEIGSDGDLTPVSDPISHPAKAHRAQEEKNAQEGVLGRIFDVEPYLIKGPAFKQARKTEEKPAAEASAAAPPGQEFINSVKQATDMMREHLGDEDEYLTAQHKALELIGSAAKKYAESGATSLGPSSPDSEACKGSTASGAGPPVPKASEAGRGKTGEPVVPMTLTSKSRGKQKESKPEDIDIEAPFEQLDLDTGDPMGTRGPSNGISTPATQASPSRPASRPPLMHALSDVEKAVENLQAQKQNFKTLAAKLQNLDEQASELNKEVKGLLGSRDFMKKRRRLEAERQELSTEILAIQKEMSRVEVEIADSERQLPTGVKQQSSQQCMHEYLRSTRGLALEALDIYLIPVKASVISKAIDIHVLKELTLLNVGPQAALWTYFQRANTESPLSLRSIFTDNVTVAFLNFVNSMDEMHNLYMLERGKKYRPESFAPKTNTTITQIRRLVLKKHMSTLRRLMIKNEGGTAWDLDDKTVQLICRRGEALQELACSMPIRSTLHTLLQRISGLPELVALHIIKLRQQDVYNHSLSEIKKFFIDNLTHHPQMKLEWISIDEGHYVDRLIREDFEDTDDNGSSQKSAKDKGKQTASTPATSSFSVGTGSTFPLFPPLNGWSEGHSDSDDSDDDRDFVSTITRERNWMLGVKEGIEIFKKVIVNGRL